jgi:hypothetical protein
MHSVLVSLSSGAGVVRTEHGVLVTNDVADGGGSYLRDADPFHPEKSWVSATQCVVGGLLPPGAVSAEAVDDRGERVSAAVGEGAYVALLEQPNDGAEPIVCCRDGSGRPVRRPWAADYPSRRVNDAEEKCPACGAIDWDEYTPFEEWRGGRGSKVDGTHVASPVVSCVVCGHEEREPAFTTYGSEPEDEDEATRAARLARARAQHRKHDWLAGALTLRAAQFPIYAAEDYRAKLGGSGSQGDDLTEITVHQYDGDDVDADTDEQPCLAVTTESTSREHHADLVKARHALGSWSSRGAGADGWPDASYAAMTLWLRARDRERRAASLGAVRSDQVLVIDGAEVPALALHGPVSRWVARAHHADLTITVAARDIPPTSLRLEPIANPAARLLGPEPPDA